MTSALHRRCVAAIQAWCAKRKLTLVGRPCHVYPRAYVLGSVASECLVVAEPWADAEPQMRDLIETHSLRTVRVFDRSLRAGMWCTTAYVCQRDAQETVAIPLCE